MLCNHCGQRVIIGKGWHLFRNHSEQVSDPSEWTVSKRTVILNHYRVERERNPEGCDDHA